MRVPRWNLALSRTPTLALVLALTLLLFPAVRSMALAADPTAMTPGGDLTHSKIESDVH